MNLTKSSVPIAVNLGASRVSTIVRRKVSKRLRIEIILHLNQTTQTQLPRVSNYCDNSRLVQRYEFPVLQVKVGMLGKKKECGKLAPQ